MHHMLCIDAGEYLGKGNFQGISHIVGTLVKSFIQQCPTCHSEVDLGLASQVATCLVWCGHTNWQPLILGLPQLCEQVSCWNSYGLPNRVYPRLHNSFQYLSTINQRPYWKRGGAWCVLHYAPIHQTMKEAGNLVCIIWRTSKESAHSNLSSLQFTFWFRVNFFFFLNLWMLKC